MRRTFYLVRHEDESGVSGTGVVADGVAFEGRFVVVCFRGDISSTITYKSIDDVLAIHGHNGKTEIVWD